MNILKPSTSSKMLVKGLPRPFHNRIQKLLNRTGRSNGTLSTDCTDGTDDYSTFDALDSKIKVEVVDEKDLINLCKGLKSGALSYAKSIELSFSAIPTQKLGQMKEMKEVFVALGHLPHLEEVFFNESAIYLDSVNKLFKKALLRKLKFHHCKFIVARRSQENLWNKLKHQERLEVLEIVDCTTIPFQNIRHNNLSLVPKEVSAKFTFQFPLFLQEQRLPMLQRLALDGCIFDCSKQNVFVKFLSQNKSLQELEICPVFETKAERRHQYQVKKAAIQHFMTKAIPTTLSSNNKHLKKLVVSLPEQHLDHIYEDAMTRWIELVQHDNSVLTQMQATHQPLLSSAKDTNGFGLYPNSWLECNLQYYLRINRQLESRRVLDSDNELDGVGEEVMPDQMEEAHDVSCLRQLLQSRPDLDALTQSVQPRRDETALFASTRSLQLVCYYE